MNENSLKIDLPCIARTSTQNTYYLITLGPNMSVNRIEVEENGTEIVQPKNNLESQTSTKTTEQQGNALSSWHYISWLFGVMLTCLTVSLITLLPARNILKEPDYWYENVLLITMAGWHPIFITAFILQLEFWSNITYTKNIRSWIICYVISVSTSVIFEIIYHHSWTEILGFFPPAPFNGYIGGTMSIFMIFYASWFRLACEID